MASEKFMILDPAYRKLQNLKELVREENATSKISTGIDEVIDLLKVSVTAANCITGIKLRVMDSVFVIFIFYQFISRQKFNKDFR